MTKTVNSNYLSIASPGSTFNNRISADSDTFARNDIDSLGNALDLHDHSSGKGLPINNIPSGGLTIAAGGLTVQGNSTNSQFNGFVTVLDGTGSASQPTTGAVRLTNGATSGLVTVRDHLNASDLAIGFDTSDRLVIQTVAGNISGSDGGASGNRLIINVNGTQYKLALLNT